MIKRCVILNGIYIIDEIKVKQLFSLKQASRPCTKPKSDAEPFLAQSDKLENDKQMFEIVIPVSKVLTLITSLCSILSQWKTSNFD